MTQAVTELIIDARGAQQGTAEYLQLMERAQRAVDQLIDRQSSMAQMAASGAVAMTSSSQTTTRLAAAVDRLKAAIDPTHVSSRQLNSSLILIDDAVKRLGVSQTEANRLMDLARDKYDAVAMSARRQKDEVMSLAAAERLSATSADGQTQWNAFAGVSTIKAGAARESAAVFERELDRFAEISHMKAQEAGLAFSNALDARMVAGAGKSARDAASVFEVELSRLDDIARMKAQEAGANFQIDINSRLGIGANSKSARDSASAFEEAGREAEQMTARVARLRAEINPLGAAQARLNTELAEYQGMAARAEISTMELAQAQSVARSRFEATTQAMSAQHQIQSRGAGGHYQTANIAAQFQDIGVTAAMGMSPIMIALQQGTQLSAALGGQGLRGTVGALGAAFASVLSPVSLLTIGVVALGAVGLQSLMGLAGGVEDATKALEVHKKWLDQLLIGYEAAGKAANDTLMSAQKLPQGVVESDLNAGLKAQAAQAAIFVEDIAKAQQSVAQIRADLSSSSAPSMFGVNEGPDLNAIRAQTEILGNLNLSLASTTPQIEAAMVASRELFNTAENPSIKDMADAVYSLALRLTGLRSETASTISALAALNNQAMQMSLSAATDQAASAIERLRNLAPDLRTGYEKATDELNIAMAKAPDQIIRQAAQGEFAKTIAALDEQARQQEALKASRSGGKTVDQWQSASDNFQQRIASTKMEIDALGQSSFSVERNKAAFDLLNQAKAAGIPITSAVTASINSMATEFATVQVALERQTEAFRKQREEVEFYRGVAKGVGQDFASGFVDRMGSADADHEASRIKYISDLMAEASRDGTTVAIGQRTAIMEMAGAMADAERGANRFEMAWKAAWESAANAAVNALDKLSSKAMDMVTDGIFDMILGAIGGAVGGGFGTIGVGGVGMPSGGFTPGLSGPWLNAKGNVYDSPSLRAYSNQIVSSPTMFAFAKGAGIMGEEPGSPGEAIMPLGRDSSGRLGVRTANENRRSANQNGNIPRVTVNNYGTPQSYEVQSVSRDEIVLIARDEIDSFSRHTLPGRVRDISDDSFGS